MYKYEETIYSEDVFLLIDNLFASVNRFSFYIKPS